ncbi:unnamed protein product [Ixodes pacificus]
MRFELMRVDCSFNYSHKVNVCFLFSKHRQVPSGSCNSWPTRIECHICNMYSAVS